MDERDELVIWTDDNLALAGLKEEAIDAECDGDLKTALNLWEQVKMVAKNEDNRKRAIKKIDDLKKHLNPPEISPPPFTPVSPAKITNISTIKRRISVPVVREPKATSVPLKVSEPLQTIYPPKNTFTRRKMLYLGLGSVGTVGAIVFGRSNSRQPTELIFTFESVKLNPKGEIIDRISGESTYFSEDLGNGVRLDMVKIPAGTFKMGASQAEYEDANKYQFPQRKVNVNEFWIGRFAVTQAQWKMIARLPKIKVDLEADSSNFKGDALPVERVSWNQAKEFCDRLSRKAGKTFDLPTEAQWEYACRARTTTPFHFGETITAYVANFDGNNTPYGKASPSIYRKQTIEVDKFAPNAFGLHNMHGNVSEWCLDPWHDNYNGAPSDDRVWDDSDDFGYKILRGGSFVSSPRNCRSACRDRGTVDTRNLDYGFRVVYSSSRIIS